MSESSHQPDTMIDSKDRGDDVLLRYYYQISCAAIAALQMFDDSLEIKEVICEQFEDYLLKSKTGFIAVQVKTRELENNPFSIKDDQVVKIISKFTEHEIQFPSNFKRFTIVSNHGFSKVKSNSLERLIVLAKEGDREEILKKRSTSLKVISVVSKKLKCSEDVVIQVLRKIELRGSYCSLNDIKKKLIHALKNLEFISNTAPTLQTLENLSDILILKFFEMSSLQNTGDEFKSMIIGNDRKHLDRVRGKRITASELKDVITMHLSNPITHYVNVPESISNIRGSNDRLELKMDKGGIDIDNVLLHKDYKYSAQKHFITMLYKHGPVESNLLYNQIRLIVQTECQEAYDENSSFNEPFGLKMLIEIRKRIKHRINNESENFKDMSYEHVLGIAAILTEDCKVWWSEKFEIK